jgi:hypothetical protein
MLAACIVHKLQHLHKLIVYGHGLAPTVRISYNMICVENLYLALIQNFHFKIKIINRLGQFRLFFAVLVVYF